MDARSLLRAKKAEARIEHPHATYTATGVLRCSICAIPGMSLPGTHSLYHLTSGDELLCWSFLEADIEVLVKQWDAHILTKQHRTSVAREKASQAKAAAKRPAEEDDLLTGSKRARLGANGGGEDDEEKEGGDGPGPSGLPAGFFSAGNRPAELDEEDEDERGNEAGPSTSTPVPVPAVPAKTGDAELDDFFASLAENAPDPTITPTTAAPTTQARRTVPSYRAADVTGVASYEAAPIRIILEEKKDEDVEPEPEPEESEQERRERVTREEREEIMGRLDEEERAQ